MKKSKQLMALIMAGVMAASLTGCATTPEAETSAIPSSEENVSEAQTTAAPPETTNAETEKADEAQTSSQPVLKEMSLELSTGTKLQYFSYSAAEDGCTCNRASMTYPIFYIFGGNQTEDQANQMVTELGMGDEVQTWAGSIHVINPLNGGSYGEEDLAAFLELVKSQGAVRNVKVIGVDDGAAFVNNHVSQNCYFIAGIFTYGGEMEAGLDYLVPVPVYVSNGSQTALDYYAKANAQEALALTESGNDPDLAAAFDNAWNKVLKKNYRFYNEEMEFYNCTVTDYTTPYELAEVVDFEALGIQYHTYVDASVTGMEGAYTWFEYVPETVLAKEEKTVPLVVTCHGNGNDPRIQGDTSGWPEVAAREGFIVVSPEWQPSDVNFTKCDGLGEDGVIALIGDLMEKYPQIDPSRIYISGLSAGGALSFMMGVKHSDLFAAAAPVSGVNFWPEDFQNALDSYEGHGTPLLYMCGDHDFFQMIPVDGSSPYGQAGYWESEPNVKIFPLLQGYQKILGLPVSEAPDMAANSYYGIALDNQGMVSIGAKQMYSGTLSNDDGVVMELGAIINQPHWNCKAQADYIWNFFSRYRRNTETGEIIFNQ